MAVTKLVSSGKLSLDKSLTDYLPELIGRIENADKITLRMLVQHRSGIPNYTDSYNYWVAPKENDDEKQKKPIMFYDSGELGWSIYLAAHINYLIEKRIYGAVTVCAPKARHVLYKDIKNVITLDIPKEIKEQTKNLDQDGTHLYDHSTKQRVKNDVLHKIFQDYFKNYNVSQ